MSQKLIEKNIKPIVGWDNGKDIFFLYRENNEKKKCVIQNFKWYFAIFKKDYDKDKILKIVEKIVKQGYYNPVIKIKVSTDFVKIYCDKRNKATNIFLEELKNNNIEPREADLTLCKRYMVDNHVEIEEDLSFLFFDIETNDTEFGIDIGKSEIVSWAAVDSKGKKYFEMSDDLVKGEAKILKKLLDLFTKYDLIIGWNSGSFDIPYIESRIEKLVRRGELKNVYNEEYWKHFMHIDLMQRFIKLFGTVMNIIYLKGFSLDEVSQTFLKKNKVKFEGKIIDLYNKDPKLLKKYNLVDVQLLYELNDKLNTIPLMIKECAWTGTFMNKFYIGELLDNFILREAHKKKYHLKSRPKYGENDENVRIRGGYVMTPKVGLYENIKCYDFKSLYPSIIVGWNIGQDSLIEGEISEKADKNFKKWLGNRELDKVDFREWYDFLKEQNKLLNPNNKYYQAGNNQFFRKNKKSIIADLIKRLLLERKKYKKLQYESKYGTLEYTNAEAAQIVVKEMANSCFGIHSDKQARFYDARVAEAITLTGQLLNRTAISIFEKEGYLVISSDTDSCFCKVDSDNDKEIENMMNEKISKHLKSRYKIEDNIIYLEYEKKFKRFLVQDKKRYTGWLVELDGKEVDTIFTKGLENIKKNTIKLTKDKINEFLDLLLRQNKDVDFFKEWLQDFKDHVLNDKIEGKELMITTKISKPVSSYKSKPPHVQLAEKMIGNKEILETAKKKKTWGQKIEYIIVDNLSKDNKGILYREFNGEWDRKYYWDVQIYAPLHRMLKAIWPDEEWDNHNILIFEKIQKQKDREEEKERKRIKREKEKEQREEERERKKIEKEEERKEKDKRKKEKEIEKIQKEKEKELLKKEKKQGKLDL